VPDASVGGADLLGLRIGAALIDLALLLVLFVVLAAVVGEASVDGRAFFFTLDGSGMAVYVALALLYYLCSRRRSGRPWTSRPLLRPPQIEDLLTRHDHTAGDDPGNVRRYLASRDRDHRPSTPRPRRPAPLRRRSRGKDAAPHPTNGLQATNAGAP